MNAIEFPEMRNYVLDALESLSDKGYQEIHWGRYDPERNSFDDLSLNVHILYDDTRVLPEPAEMVGAVLHPEDVPPLAALFSVLDPMIAELGDSPDSAYLAHPGWDAVVKTAEVALHDLRSRGHR